MARGMEFADLVRKTVYSNKETTVSKLAETIGLSYHALHSRLSNRVTFSAEEIRRVITHLPDSRIPAWLLDGTDFIPARRTLVETDTGLPDDSLRHSSIMMMIEAGEVAHEIEKAISDQRIDHREAQTIQQEIEAAERAIATVREHVRLLTN